MKNKVVFGRSLMVGLVLLLCLVFVSQATVYAADKIVLGKYSDLKIGFTTANFLKFYPPSVPNLKKLLDFASDQGFAFIEIRDPNASLTVNECKEIAAYSRHAGVEIIYAMNPGALDANYWEVFSRGIANAQVFDGPKVIRIGANGGEMMVSETKTYWTAEDFAKIVENTNHAANIAKMFGLQFLTENARESLQGDGVTTFGTTELFGAKWVNSNVGLQMDTGNFFCTARIAADPGAVQAFLVANAGKIGYTHLKTSKNHVPQQVLDGNELPFDPIFKLLQKNGKNYLAIELDAAATLDDAFANHVKSVQYLKKNY
jgi:sugar phosphate isomerase/epimerase